MLRSRLGLNRLYHMGENSLSGIVFQPYPPGAHRMSSVYPVARRRSTVLIQCADESSNAEC